MARVMTRGSALALAFALLLAGCGNDPTAGAGTVLFRDVAQVLRSKVAGKKPGEGTPSEAQIARLVPLALERVKGSALLALLNDGKQVAVLGEQEDRAGYRTYTTTDRQTLTLRGGVLNATRGLGGDLMGADVSGSARLIRARSGGEAAREMRWLSGEWQEEAERYSCRISRDSAETIPSATGGQVATQRMIEICRPQSRDGIGGGETFTNIYWVGSTGTIWQSRQWIGPEKGYIALSLLRP